MGIESKYFDATDNAKHFVKSHITIDSLAACVDHAWPEEDMFEDYHERALATGVDVIGMTASFSSNDFMTLQNQVSRFLKHIHNAKETYDIVRNVGDIKRMHEEGKHGLFFNAQGCEILNNNPAHFAPIVKNSGVGTVAIAYNERFRAGDGCLVKNPDKITLYGEMVIDSLHANQIILDLSHSSEITALSAMEYSMKVAPETPVLYTHSTPLGVCDIYRSITDAEVQMCAETGGVIALVTLPWFIVDPMALETTPADIVRAIDYVRDLVGVDHIALASDDSYSWLPVWEWTATVPEKYQDGGLTAAAAKNKPCGSAEAAKVYPAIVDLLWERDYSDEEIAKILGLNLMRIYEQVWG